MPEPTRSSAVASSGLGVTWGAFGISDAEGYLGGSIPLNLPLFFHLASAARKKTTEKALARRIDSLSLIPAELDSLSLIPAELIACP